MNEYINKYMDEYMDEYTKISNVLKNVSEKVNKYKENINQKITGCNNEEDKKRYIDEYNNFVSLIQNDSDITRKFTYLRSRQEELENIINEYKTKKLSIDKSLIDLKSKYSL